MIARRSLTLIAISIFAVLGLGTAGEDDTTTAVEGLSAAAEAPADLAADPPPAAVTSTFVSGNVHCNSPDINVCEEISQIGASSPFARGNCDTVGGTWGDGPCPSENRLGHCDALGSRNHYYAGEFMSADGAAEACNLVRGTWTAAE